ncbi:MAG: arginine deiminase family protein [Nitratireductor sp.]
MKEGRSWRFTHAVSRLPGKSIANGLRAGGGADPDPAEFLAEHQAYTKALAETGANVSILDPLEEFPDSVFVEDAALCAGGTAIILRPGAESRFGEAAEIAPALEKIFGSVKRLERGFVDGGDILLTDDEALIGMSERTDQEGVDALSEILEPLGYRVRVVNTPSGVLHFKSDCGLLDSHTVFSTARLAGSGCFEGYRVIEAVEGEEAATNLIRFNEPVFLRTGFPKTLALLQSEGYKVITLSADQAALVDGGLSCMSLRFSL